MAILNQLNGRQIRNGVLMDAHVAENAAIAEAKLDIDWAARYEDALQTKKIIDYVQFNGVTVAEDDAFVDIEQGSGIGKINNSFAATSADYGVSAEYPVVIRDAVTGSPINVSNKEVWGLVSYTPAVVEPPEAAVYTVTFKTGVFGSGTNAAIPEGVTSIDMQYACRFDLSSVPENFAANEKWVDGMVDVTEINNLKQMAKDLYGSAWTLDNDGVANLTTSIKDEIARLDDDAETTGSVKYVVKTEAMDVLASTANGEGAALVGIYDDAENFSVATTVEGALAEICTKISDAALALASDVEGSGAALVAVEDNDVFTATTVQGALEELEDRIGTLETTGNQEIIDTHTREAASTNGVFKKTVASNPAEGEILNYASIEARILSIETVVDDDVQDLATLSSDLGATTANKGAKLIGFNDPNNQFTATTVEAALDEALDAAQAAQSAAEGAQSAAEGAQGDATDALEDTGALITLSGVAAHATDLGEFTGETIADGSDIKEALQALETQLETTDGVADQALADAGTAQGNVDNLVTLSGVAKDATHLGEFTGATIADSSDVKEALQALETQLETTDGIADNAATWITNNNTKVHAHTEEVSVVAVESAEYTTTATFTVGTDFIGVYVNGVRQLPTTHFTIAQGTGGSATKAKITFAEALGVGDNIYLEFVKYNVNA